MSDYESGPNGLRYRLGECERRLSRLENFEPAVMARKLDDLDKDVTSLKRAFYTFAFGVVGSAILFAFTVFALLGKGP